MDRVEKIERCFDFISRAAISTALLPQTFAKLGNFTKVQVLPSHPMTRSHRMTTFCISFKNFSTFAKEL